MHPYLPLSLPHPFLPPTYLHTSLPTPSFTTYLPTEVGEHMRLDMRFDRLNLQVWESKSICSPPLLFQVQSPQIQMGLFGRLVVHLHPDGFNCFCPALRHRSVRGVPPCSGHRHLLQRFHSPMPEEASSRGQRNGRGQQRGREAKGWKTRTEQREGRKGDGSWEKKRSEWERRHEFHEEEGLHHRRHHPGCPHAELPPLHRLPASEGSSSSSYPQMSA